MAGKFSAKNREHAVDVRTILAEREQAQQRRSGVPAAPQKRKPAQPAEPAKPRSQKNARSTKKAVKGPRLGGVIFYTIFLYSFSCSISQLTLAYWSCGTG